MKKILFLVLSLNSMFASSQEWLQGGNTITGTNSFTNTLQRFGTINSMDLFFMTGGAQRMILKAGGNFGIGTSNPLDRLHLNAGGFRISGNTAQNGPMISFGGTTTTGSVASWGIEFQDGINIGNNPGLNFWKPFGSSGVGFGNYFLFLSDNSGFVGINTNTPSARLTVNGNMLIGDPSLVPIVNQSMYSLYVQKGILTERVKVALYNTTDWSDFVFMPTYYLRPIGELNQFILKNRHLPDVPSAQQLVDEKGYDLGKMDAILLQKIEELTLYIIQLNAQNEELKSEINLIKNNK